jgi:hypothetical protein
MVKHKKAKKRTDWEEDEDAEPVKSKPAKHAKKAGKKIHKKHGGRKRGHKKGSVTKAFLASGTKKAPGPKLVTKILRKHKLVIIGNKKWGYKIVYRATKHPKELEVDNVAKIWSQIKSQTYITKRKHGGYGVYIRGKNYVSKLKA